MSTSLRVNGPASSSVRMIPPPQPIQCTDSHNTVKPTSPGLQLWAYPHAAVTALRCLFCSQSNLWCPAGSYGTIDPTSRELQMYLAQLQEQQRQMLAFIAAKHKHKQEVREAEVEGLAPPPMPDFKMVAMAASGCPTIGCLFGLRCPVPSRLLAAYMPLRCVMPGSRVVQRSAAHRPLRDGGQGSISVLFCRSSQSCRSCSMKV